MEEEICSTLNVQEKIQLWELEQKILRHLSEMGCKENRQEVLLT